MKLRTGTTQEPSWVLTDARAMGAAYPDTFDVPDQELIELLALGDTREGGVCHE